MVCCVIDRQKYVSLISSWYCCRRFQSLQTMTRYEKLQQLSTSICVCAKSNFEFQEMEISSNDNYQTITLFLKMTIHIQVIILKKTRKFIEIEVVPRTTMTCCQNNFICVLNILNLQENTRGIVQFQLSKMQIYSLR